MFGTDRAADPRRQPAEADRRARRCDENVPCETQQTPDLRSKPGAPPQQRKADTSSQLFKDRWAKVRQYGIDLMKQQLKREGLAGQAQGLRQGPHARRQVKKLGKAGK